MSADKIRQSQSLPAGAVAGLAAQLRQMACWCKSSEDDDGTGTFIPAYASGDVFDILTQAALQADAREKGEAVGWAAIDTRGKPIELFLTEAGAMAWAGWGDDLDPSIKFSHVIPLYATQPAQASEAAGSVSVKKIPRRKAYPKPDENGNETGPIEQHAYIEGWNDCVAAIRLATSSQETASE